MKGFEQYSDGVSFPGWNESDRTDDKDPPTVLLAKVDIFGRFSLIFNKQMVIPKQNEVSFLNEVLVFEYEANDDI